MRKLMFLLAVVAFGVVGLAFASEAEAADCYCMDVWAPVCGEDGVTYGNECMADCAGVKVAYPGVCHCICPHVILPVCGEDGVTYDNSCLAACAGVKVAYEGPCKEFDTP